MGQFLLSSAIIRSRTPGNVVGSRLGLYFPLLADKTNTNDKVCSRGTEKKKPTEIRAIDSISIRLQDPRNRCFFWKTLPGEKSLI